MNDKMDKPPDFLSLNFLSPNCLSLLIASPS